MLLLRVQKLNSWQDVVKDKNFMRKTAAGMTPQLEMTVVPVSIMGKPKNTEKHEASQYAAVLFNNISNEPAIQYGARCVSEQKFDHNKMGCHTARYARAVSMYNEARYGGRNATLTDWAFRAWNWASYMVLENGLAVVGPAASLTLPNAP